MTTDDRTELFHDTSRRYALYEEHRDLVTSGWSDRDAVRYLAEREHVTVPALVIAIRR